MIGLVAATANGRRNAVHLASVWKDTHLYAEGPKEALHRAWDECDAIVVFLATGAVVRLIAPLLGDKHQDPGVVSVMTPESSPWPCAVDTEADPNALAERVAETLGATPVITTASDSLGVPALDTLGEKLGFEMEDGSDVAAVGSALVSGETVHFVSEQRWLLGALPENLLSAKHSEEPGSPLILISDRLVDAPQPKVVYRPPSLVVGVGCSRGPGPKRYWIW